MAVVVTVVGRVGSVMELVVAMVVVKVIVKSGGVGYGVGGSWWW